MQLKALSSESGCLYHVREQSDKYLVYKRKLNIWINGGFFPNISFDMLIYPLTSIQLTHGCSNLFNTPVYWKVDHST